jgi:hypothetical protein
VTIGWLFTDAIAVLMLQGVAGGDAPPPPSTILATEVVGVLLAGVALTLVVASFAGLPEPSRRRVLLVGMVGGVLAVPAWVVVARLAS